MEPALQRRVQRYGWDKASSYYEDFWQRQLKPAQDLLLEMADLQPGEIVLDVACGTGLISFSALTKLGEKGRVLGTDISEKMVEMSSLLAMQKGENRLQFMRMDAEDLELDLASRIENRTGRTLEDSERNPLYGRIETVRDLVRFFSAQPRSPA